MGMTLLAVGALVAPLLGELGRQWLGRNNPLHARAPAVTGATARDGTPRAIPSSNPNLARSRPLRVVRVAEPLRGPASAGRMVISGRMADVCAELDRLAALESAPVRH
ncbi:MAG TPA: hypothetical protein VKP68_04755 [Ramlibacter sp.]|nr:hypothetical protein [Ramlibacter sp.]